MCYGTILENKLRLARKNHVCNWCGEKIEPRTKYWNFVEVEDAAFIKTKMHPECEEASDEARDYDGCLYLNQYQPRGRFDEDLV